MKKAIIPFAALAISLASCDTGVKDSYQSTTFVESNLVIDTEDASQPAYVSSGKYEVKINYSKDLIDVKGSDIIINNQKYSFESTPTNINITSYTTSDGLKAERLSFEPSNSAGSSATDIKGEYMYWTVPSTSNPLNTTFDIGYVVHLNMNYKIMGRYQVQSFSSNAFYTGTSTVTEGSNTFSTKKPTYAVIIDFEKKVATVYIYNPEYSAEMPESYTKLICLAEVPVSFSHDRYGLSAAAPKTTILGKNASSQDALIESDDIKVTDFALTITSSDLTDASITYKLGGKDYFFRGCSVVKPGI